MPGRPRRASTSSVESIDENQIQWRQETSVVKTVPKGVHSDDWPIFELRDAVVLNKDGQRLENALEVCTMGPYIVRGHLIIDDPSQRTHLIMRVRSSIPIEIRPCISYSIGESDDSHPRPLIWVSGRGGWYEIDPAPEYRPIYDKMCEATTLYYNTIDIYNSIGPKKSKKSKTDWKEELAPIFLQYAIRIGDGSTFEEVVQRCHDHAPFILTQFLQENEDFFDWKPTHFYKWLTAEHSELFTKAQNMIKNPPELPKISPRNSSPALSLPSRSRETRSVSSARGYDTPDVAVPRPQLPSRTSARSSSSKPAPTNISEAISVPVQEAVPPAPLAAAPPTEPPMATEADDSPLKTIIDALEWAYESLAESKNGMKVSATINKIYFAYKFPNFRNGTSGSHRIPVEETLHYYAKALLDHLDPAKYGRHEIYAWLQEKAATPLMLLAMTPDNFPFRLVPRSKQTRKPASEQLVAGDHTATGSNVTPSSAAATPRVGKRVPGVVHSTTSRLRLTQSSKKRVHAALESDSEAAEPGPKRSHYFSDDETMQDTHDTSSADEDESASSQGEEEDVVRIYMRADRIPSTTPRGPDGTWTCDEGDCGYIVRGGDERECQDRIQEHFRFHEQTARVNLAKSESRGLLPINHLLDKIKALSDKDDGHSGGSPTPIKRKLIV
ncbi:hypothetical protein B0I35DRAFT_432383 [Stachybotrys elegans]|uniref:DNA (cytosine-5)-methyltransferase 1 replication foci domain-containing protein n=1 Tax=Stachybotrys elegans TaxID=80388 RepID=A0A8K0SVG7_9HYPO|nr:hypothetical protein B0I35DRAFT_432383 [Stachybotrys elegans]